VACRCHADAPAGVGQETEACRCHLLDAEGIARAEDRRIPESAWQPGQVPTPSGNGIPEPAAPARRFRAAVDAVILVPALAGAAILVVSGLVPIFVTTVALFLPALVPLLLVGLSILFTRELPPVQEKQESSGRHSQEPVPDLRPTPVVW
jgi:hypothetical protein